MCTQKIILDSCVSRVPSRSSRTLPKCVQFFSSGATTFLPVLRRWARIFTHTFSDATCEQETDVFVDSDEVYMHMYIVSILRVIWSVVTCAQAEPRSNTINEMEYGKIFEDTFRCSKCSQILSACACACVCVSAFVCVCVCGRQRPLL